ncbi:MAG: phage repressor protein [Thiovulaceae bacterium]|nr:phage repressor protein [Sulfurimonadaceae bacterium]
MKNFSEIVEEIKDIISPDIPGKKVFDKDVAQALDITQMNFATMKKRDKIPFEELLDFCAKRSIAINWLLYDQTPESLIESTNQVYLVRYFNAVNASAGGGGFADEGEEYENLVLEPHFVATLGGERELKNIQAVNVSGDSMEPTFLHGDIIFLNCTKNDISRGGIFAIQTEEMLLVKRLQKRIDGKIDIISDNKDFYLPQIASAEQINILGRVVGRYGSVE